MELMEAVWTPLLLSLRVALVATAAAFTAGVLLAWLFAFYKNRWTSFLSILVTLPLILPPTVLGYYLLVSIGRNSFIGRSYEQLTGGPLVFTWQAAVIAAAIAALPLLIRPIQADTSNAARFVLLQYGFLGITHDRTPYIRKTP